MVRVEGQAHRCRVKLDRVRNVAILRRLMAVKHGSFELPTFRIHAASQNPIGNVRAIEPVMRDRRLWNFGPAWAMHERWPTKRGLADRASIKERPRSIANRMA